jgi:hypothetical protein
MRVGFHLSRMVMAMHEIEWMCDQRTFDPKVNFLILRVT